jgi:DNA-binding MarR family transcriptional regulator
MRAGRGVRTSLAMGAYRSLVAAAEAIVGHLERQLAPIDATITQYRALEALFFHGPMSQSKLCQFTFTGSSSTGLALRALQRQNMLTRRVDENHRKRHVVTITPRGKIAVAKFAPFQTKLIRGLMAALDRREQATLTRLCNKLAAGDEDSLLRELVKTLREGR